MFQNIGFLHNCLLQYPEKRQKRESSNTEVGMWESYLPRNNYTKAWRNFCRKIWAVLQVFSWGLTLKVLHINSSHFHSLTGTYSTEYESLISRNALQYISTNRLKKLSHDWLMAYNRSGKWLDMARNLSRKQLLTSGQSHFLSEQLYQKKIEASLMKSVCN